MQVIWKFTLAHATTSTSQSIELPIGARIVYFGLQALLPTIWVHLDPAPYARRETRTFTIYGTGADMPDHAVHIGSWFEGNEVWHLVEVTKP